MATRSRLALRAAVHFLSAGAATLTLSGCNKRIPDSLVEVESAYVTLPIVAGRSGAAYFELRSNNDPTRLTGIASPDVERIELHSSVMEGRMARMRPLDGAIFPDSKLLRFAPGGNHAMLFGIAPGVKAGDKIRLTFRFEPAPAVTAEAEVRAFGNGQ